MKYLSKSQEQMQPTLTLGYMNLIRDFGLLMLQLSFLTRTYIASVYSGFGDEAAVAERLYNLPNQFKAKAELIFGAPLSEEFLALLSSYVLYIQSMAHAMKAGDQTTADHYVRLLYKNADDIAAQYAKMNPFWDEIRWRTLLFNYVNLVIQDAIALGNRDFVKDLDIYDRMLLAALAMGDYQAEGFLLYLTATRRDHIGKCE